MTGFRGSKSTGKPISRCARARPGRVTLEATAQGLKQIRTEVRGRTLRISLVDQSHWWQWMTGGSSHAHAADRDRPDPDQSASRRPARSDIVADALKANELRLDFAGACKLKIGDLQATQAASGRCGRDQAEIAGKVAEQSIDLSGAGIVSGRRPHQRQRRGPGQRCGQGDRQRPRRC